MVDSLRILGSAPAPENAPTPSIAAACRVADFQDIDHVGSEREVEDEGPRATSPWATCDEMPTNLDSRSSRQLQLSESVNPIANDAEDPSESVNPIVNDAEDVLMTEPPGRRPPKDTLEGGPQYWLCIRRASATAGLPTLRSTKKGQITSVLERLRVSMRLAWSIYAACCGTV